MSAEQTTDWVEQSDWSKVPRGARVQLRRPLGHVEGICGQSDHESMLVTFSATDTAGVISHREYRDRGWELFVASTPLPTEPGAVIRISNEDDRWHWLFWVAVNGTWDGIDFRGQGLHGIANPVAWLREQDEMIGAVDRLEPESVTHARILPSLREAAHCISRSSIAGTDVSTVDVRSGRRILANLITELEATK